MIDLDILEIQAKNTCLKECKYLSTASLLELINRLREAEKDAARYRWLRDKVDRPYCGVLFIDGLVGGDYIDCFIDGEMKEKGDE